MEHKTKIQIVVMPGHSSIGSGAGGIRVVKPGFRHLGNPVEPINDQRGEQSGGRGGGRRVELNGEGQTKPQRHVAPKWQLDDVSLAALVRALGPDTEQAGRRYASLRERLVRFFEWNRVPIADELADETLDRLARRLGRTETAATNENTNDLSPAEAVERPEEFAAGIARLVLYEQRRRQIRAEQAFESIERESAIDLVLAQTENSQHAEELSAVLDACMAELTREQRELIGRYYNVNGRTMIDARKLLAQEMGISINALRNRALRIRAELENRMRSRLRERG